MTAIDAVIFDWGGTLTPWHTLDPREAWISAVSDEELADRLLVAEQELWLRARDEHRSGSLTEVFESAGVVHTEEMLAAFSSWWEARWWKWYCMA